MPEAPLIIRGGRAIAPHEVERVLLGHPAVAEVAVVGVPDRFLDEIVGAAIRLSAPLPSAAADLTDYCRVLLAPYKVPTRWLFTPALPRTRDGAVRRAVLSAQLAAESWLDRAPWPAGASWPAGMSGPAGLLGPAGVAGVAGTGSFDAFRPRPAIEDLRVPQQVRRGPWAHDDL